MIRTRVIPTLLLKGNGLVKGKNFKGHKYVGDPINAVRIFNDKEVDELVLLDITATIEGKEPNYDLIKDISSECFMPMAYGGGIRSFSQAQKLFSNGVEKVILNSVIFSNPQLITEISKVYGNQSVIVSLDVKKNMFGKYELYSHSGTKKEAVDFWKLLSELEGYGAGEVILTSIDKEGTGVGFDLNITKQVADKLTIPVIASGGPGEIDHIKQAFDKTNLSGVAIGNMFVFYGKHKAVLITYLTSSQIKDISGNEIKS